MDLQEVREFEGVSMDSAPNLSLYKIISSIISYYEIVLAISVVFLIIELVLIKAKKNINTVLFKIINIIIAILLGTFPVIGLVSNIGELPYSAFAIVELLIICIPSVLLIVKSFLKEEKLKAKKIINIVLTTIFILCFIFLLFIKNSLA